MPMHPKTFQIRLVHHYRHLSDAPCVFRLHANTAQDALDWVARVFVGIDVAPTLRRWQEQGSSPIRVGNDDPVIIIDCDAFRSPKGYAACKGAEAQPQHGAFRISAEDAGAEMLRLFLSLQNERKRWMTSFVFMKDAYEKGRAPNWTRDRLVELKHACEMTLLWQDNLWQEYLAVQRTAALDPALDLPAERQMAASDAE